MIFVEDMTAILDRIVVHKFRENGLKYPLRVAA